MEMEDWYQITNTEEIASPCLLVYPERIANNIQKMIATAGGTKRLRPHIKTHKIAEIVQMQLEQGIDKFKCATIAEAELLGKTGAREVLLAMQPLGPNVGRFFQLAQRFPKTHFSTLVDNKDTFRILSQTAKEHRTKVALWLDINNGMNRTGMLPDASALDLFTRMTENDDVVAEGFHVYDGHIRHTDIKDRTAACNQAFKAVTDLKNQLEARGVHVKTIVAGGTPSFPVHSKRGVVDISPGTSLLWDHRYGELFPDMAFDHAAVLMTRILSKPKEGFLCLDLGHKSVAPEMPLPRVHFLGNTDFEQTGQSEEHLVVKTGQWNNYKVGDVFYALPYHVCPTVAKYHEVVVIRDGRKEGVWNVAARNNKITI